MVTREDKAPWGTTRVWLPKLMLPPQYPIDLETLVSATAGQWSSVGDQP
jgi:hypothetical protein